MNEATFKQQLRDQGFGDAEQLDLNPNMNNDMHTHDFAASLLVLNGSFTLVTEEGEVTHHPGETCSLDAGVLHAEKTGADGARVLIGKK